MAGEAATYCVNSACPAQLVRGVEHFVSRGAMDIAGFGIKQAELFVELGYIADLADVYYLDADKLLAQEGYGEKKVANLLAAIEASKTRPPARLLVALGIQGVGEVVAEDLMAHFNSLDALAAAPVEELQAIPGIGPILAQSVFDWFAREPNRRLIGKLKAAGVTTAQAKVEVKAEAEVQPLAGLTFVITGTLPTSAATRRRTSSRRTAAKSPIRSARTPAIWWPAKPPDRSSTKPPSSACRSLTRRRCGRWLADERRTTNDEGQQSIAHAIRNTHAYAYVARIT